MHELIEVNFVVGVSVEVMDLRWCFTALIIAFLFNLLSKILLSAKIPQVT